MSDIDEMKLRRLDLTLLLIFLNLLRTRKAVDVAAHMGLTQSSISHALNRLRAVFEDPLFLRRPHGLEPTAFALALEPAIRRAVEALDGALSGPMPFDPAEASGVIRIAAYDAELAMLTPHIVNALDARAPDLRFSARALGRRSAQLALEQREVDLAFGYFWDLPDQFLAEDLLVENYLVTARADHPVFRTSMSLEAYTMQDHLVVSMSGDFEGIVDRTLERHGRSRRVKAAVPLFFPALVALTQSDMIATLPSRLVKSFATSFGLDYCQPPLDIRPFKVSALRHRRDARNTMLDWLMSEIRLRIGPLQERT